MTANIEEPQLIAKILSHLGNRPVWAHWFAAMPRVGCTQLGSLCTPDMRGGTTTHSNVSIVVSGGRRGRCIWALMLS